MRIGGLELTPFAEGSGLKLAGELDLATAGELTNALKGQSPESEVQLDVSELDFIDSSGVGAILTFVDSRNGARPLVLLNPSKSLRRLFEIVQLDTHPKIEIRHTNG